MENTHLSEIQRNDLLLLMNLPPKALGRLITYAEGLLAGAEMAKQSDEKKASNKKKQ